MSYVFKAEKKLSLPFKLVRAGEFIPVTNSTSEFRNYFKEVPYNEYVASLPVTKKLVDLPTQNGRYIIPLNATIKVGSNICVVSEYPKASRPQDAMFICSFCGGCTKILKSKRKIHCCNTCNPTDKGFIWYDELDNTKVLQNVDYDIEELI